MSISLQKGQKVDLTKGNSSLNKIIIGLGWDEKKASGKGFFGGLFSSGGGNSAIDCDASAFLCQGGKIVDKQDLVYFQNLKHYSGSINHMGDNLTGAGDGDDEQIVVELTKVPEKYDRIIFVVNIYQAIQRKQHFGLIENAYIRIVDSSSNQEICKFNLSDNYEDKYAMICGEVYRSGNDWKFNAIGEGTTDSGLGDMVKKYQ